MIFHQEILDLDILPESKMLSRNAAHAIFTMETLRTLIIGMKNCPLRSDEFYSTWAEVASSSKVCR